MGHFITNSRGVWGSWMLSLSDLTYQFRSLYYFSHFSNVLMWKSDLYWIWGNDFIFSHVIGTILTSQHTNNDYLQVLPAILITLVPIMSTFALFFFLILETFWNFRNLTSDGNIIGSSKVWYRWSKDNGWSNNWKIWCPYNDSNFHIL